MAQMKEQIKTPEKELNKMEVSNLTGTESIRFKPVILKMLKELSEDFSSIKKIQSEMKDMLIKIKNNLQGIKSRVDRAENQISDLEHKEAKNNQSEQQGEKRIQTNEGSAYQPWNLRLTSLLSLFHL